MVDPLPFVALGAVAVLIIGLTLIIARRLQARRDIDPADRAELDALGRELLADHHREVGPAHARTLERLRIRGVPLASGSVDHRDDQWVFTFADGTRLVVAGRREAAYAAVVAAQEGRVTVVGWDDDADHTSITLGVGVRRWNLTLLAVAGEQP